MFVTASECSTCHVLCCSTIHWETLTQARCILVLITTLIRCDECVEQKDNIFLSISIGCISVRSCLHAVSYVRTYRSQLSEAGRHWVSATGGVAVDSFAEIVVVAPWLSAGIDHHDVVEQEVLDGEAVEHARTADEIVDVDIAQGDIRPSLEATATSTPLSAEPAFLRSV